MGVWNVRTSVASTDRSAMTGHEFLKRLRALARLRGVGVQVQSHRGKGSHQTVCFGTARAVVPDLRREMKPGLLRGVLKQLGIDRSQWREP
jgi:mRNA interferase HicA